MAADNTTTLPDDFRVDDLELSFRVAKRLRQECIGTVGQLRTMTDCELLRIPGIGRGSLAEIRAVIGSPNPWADRLVQKAKDQQLDLNDAPAVVVDKLIGLYGSQKAKTIGRLILQDMLGHIVDLCLATPIKPPSRGP